MKNNINKFLLSIFLAGSVATAHAEFNVDYSKPYILLEGGISKHAKKLKQNVDAEGDVTNYPLEKKLKRSTSFGAGVGYQVNDNFRMDFKVNFRPDFKYSIRQTEENISQTDNQKIKALSGMVNAYYDIGKYNMFTPYVGAGIGVARINAGNFASVTDNGLSKVTHTVQKGKTTNFAYQVGAGTLINLADNIDLNIGYKFINLGKFKTKSSAVIADGVVVKDNPLKGRLTANEFMAGIQFKL